MAWSIKSRPAEKCVDRRLPEVEPVAPWFDYEADLKRNRALRQFCFTDQLVVDLLLVNRR